MTTVTAPDARRDPGGHRAGPPPPARRAPSAGNSRPARTGDPLVLLPTLLGALAVLGGSTVLVPLLDSLSWMLPLLEVVAVIWLVGIGARLLTIPAWGVVLLQLAGLVIALTSLFTGTGIAGVLPGPAAVHDIASMLGASWEQILTTVPPAPTTP